MKNLSNRYTLVPKQTHLFSFIFIPPANLSCSLGSVNEPLHVPSKNAFMSQIVSVEKDNIQENN